MSRTGNGAQWRGEGFHLEICTVNQVPSYTSLLMGPVRLLIGLLRAGLRASLVTLVLYTTLCITKVSCLEAAAVFLLLSISWGSIFLCC